MRNGTFNFQVRTLIELFAAQALSTVAFRYPVNFCNSLFCSLVRRMWQRHQSLLYSPAG
jgi:hypothetical protein